MLNKFKVLSIFIFLNTFGSAQDAGPSNAVLLKPSNLCDGRNSLISKEVSCEDYVEIPSLDSQESFCSFFYDPENKSIRNVNIANLISFFLSKESCSKKYDIHVESFFSKIPYKNVETLFLLGASTDDSSADYYFGNCIRDGDVEGVAQFIKNKVSNHSALCAAAKKGDITLLQRLLTPETGYNSRSSALLEAVCYGKDDIVRFLLDKYKDFDRKTIDRVFLLAVSVGSIKICNLLFERFDIDITNQKIRNRSLFSAARDGNVNMVKYLLEKGINSNEILSDVSGFALAVSKAAAKLYAKIVKELLKRGIDPNDTGNRKSVLPALMSWVKQGDEKTVRRLLEHGANVNVEFSILAALLEHNKCMRLPERNKSYRALDYAESLNMAKILFEWGAVPEVSRNLESFPDEVRSLISSYEMLFKSLSSIEDLKAAIGSCGLEKEKALAYVLVRILEIFKKRMIHDLESINNHEIFNYIIEELIRSEIIDTRAHVPDILSKLKKIAPGLNNLLKEKICINDVDNKQKLKRVLGLSVELNIEKMERVFIG